MFLKFSFCFLCSLFGLNRFRPILYRLIVIVLFFFDEEVKCFESEVDLLTYQKSES